MWVCSHIQSQPLWLLRTTLSHWTALPVCMIHYLFQKHFTGKWSLVDRRWTYHQMETESWSLIWTSMLQPAIVSWEWQRTSLVATSTSALLCCSSLGWKMISEESVQQMWLSEVRQWVQIKLTASAGRCLALYHLLQASFLAISPWHTSITLHGNTLLNLSAVMSDILTWKNNAQ